MVALVFFTGVAEISGRKCDAPLCPPQNSQPLAKCNNKPMTTSPPVSVIIPVWNGATVLLETLRSLQVQTYANFEAIIVDDGSTDDTAAIAQKFCETDPRFSLIRQANGGVSAARNTAIERAQGEWLAFLDGDDVW